MGHPVVGGWVGKADSFAALRNDKQKKMLSVPPCFFSALFFFSTLLSSATFLSAPPSSFV
jgi:hypothetical protein